MGRRHVILPARGTLLVNTDVHGSGEDFDRMRALFEAEPEDTHWTILGDIVHAPNEDARARSPELYDYEDRSGDIAMQIQQLREAHPTRVHFVLGNHDWAHIGGPPTGKFYDDEAAHLEDALEPGVVDVLHQLLRDALLFMAAPCGAFLSHASPGALFESLDEIDAIDLGGALDPRQTALVRELTNFYGQREAVSRSFLEHMSELCDCDLRFVVHGHDRDEDGWFIHENTQLCPVIFGAPRHNRRYLRLDLGTHYPSVDALQDGVEIRRLWDDP